MSLTFVKVAHTKYSMGNVNGGDFCRNNAERAYHEALNYFGKVSDFTSLKRWKLIDFVNQAKKAIPTLPNQQHANRTFCPVNCFSQAFWYVTRR
jgi:hypothetical protein